MLYCVREICNMWGYSVNSDKNLPF
uniref:Uncharacterized protein n=1 Tax=Anguilla anguilla TaxID=7936 RepID=A0A0E9THA8_ANGAN